MANLSSKIIAKVYNQTMENYRIFIIALLVLPVCVLAEAKNGMPVAQNTLEIHAKQLFAGSQCGNGDVAATWITTQEQLKHAYQSLQKGKIGGPTHTLPIIDFKRAGGLLIKMGQQRTGGYGVRLSDLPVTLKDKIVTLPVHWLEPTPGGIQIQVLTSPCVLIELPLNGYGQINVVDQAKSLKTTVNINP